VNATSFELLIISGCSIALVMGNWHAMKRLGAHQN
jgi:hypothetical protein